MSHRIVIAGTVDVASEDRARALAEALPHICAARAQPGCLAYDWTADPHDAGRIHVFEDWTGTAELAAHLAGPAYRGMLGHLSGFGIRGSDTRKYRVDRIEPVYDSSGVPRADFSEGQP